MRVAIVGAGVAGLSCAAELEKHGIFPVIYEKNSFIGDPYPHVTAFIRIIHRPVKDVLEYCRDRFGIDITPINNINTIVHKSPRRANVIKGELGYLFKNNREPDCLKCQMYGMLKKSTVKLDTCGDYEQLAAEFDNVVIATGLSNQARELGCWQSWVNSYIKGAYVEGCFDPNTVVIWLNKDYCRNGYAYLTPFSGRKASIVLVVTGADDKEIDYFWSMFWSSENFNYEIIETFKLPHDSGYVYPLRIGKFIFTGNSAGGFEPFLGFGALHAITMGVSAARTISEGKSYEKQVRNVIRRNKEMMVFREKYNTLTNKDIDNMVSLLGLPGIRHLIYNTGLNVPKAGAFLLKLLSRG